jgi:hypothetical protein
MRGWVEERNPSIERNTTGDLNSYVTTTILPLIDSEEGREAQRTILQAHPYKMLDKGKEEVRLRTCCGFEVTVRVGYFTRKGNRRGKKRYPGLFPGLLVLGIHERCTPGLASEVSMFAGMLGSPEEARRVLAERGVDLNIKTVRRSAYRFAERARTAQRVMELDFGAGVTGRKVAISADGGRTITATTNYQLRRQFTKLPYLLLRSLFLGPRF